MIKGETANPRPATGTHPRRRRRKERERDSAGRMIALLPDGGSRRGRQPRESRRPPPGCGARQTRTPASAGSRGWVRPPVSSRVSTVQLPLGTKQAVSQRGSEKFRRNPRTREEIAVETVALVTGTAEQGHTRTWGAAGGELWAPPSGEEAENRGASLNLKKLEKQHQTEF